MRSYRSWVGAAAWVLGCAAACVAGCGDDGAEGQGTEAKADVLADAGVLEDGVVDAAPSGPDAGLSGVDAGPLDGGTGEADGVDAGPADVDASPSGVDGGPPDGGSGGVDGAGTGDASTPWPTACDPCASSKSCVAPGIQAACASHGAAGSFCANLCASAAQCPEGHDCVELPTTEGDTQQVCAPKSASGKGIGACTCSAQAIALGLSTPCAKELVSSDGAVIASCAGTRTCGKEGLGACDAPAPMFESCNGVDDDCDGQTDEQTCDDANTCTQDACAGAAGCAHAKLSGEACDADSNLCTPDACQDGACVKGQGSACEDGNPCTIDACNPASGCTSTDADGLACDADGSKCTVGDTCKGGACQPGPIKACDDGNPCTIDACAPAQGCTATDDDGAPCDDGNACTQGDACKQGACEKGPALPCDPGAPCTAGACDPTTGKCAFTTLADGAPCDDTLPCTKPDTCKQGACAGTPLVCDDGDVCTTDLCDAKTGQCATTPAAGPCDDADACTGPDACLAGACVGAPQPVTACDDGEVCTGDACDKALGCVHTPTTAKCDDGNACTTGDVCKGGKCVGEQAACECQQDADCAAKDDGNLCNGVLYCDQSAKPFTCKDKPASVVVCDASGNTACLTNQCQPKTGECVPAAAADGKACSDGDACTAGEACAGGKCAGGKAKVCSDGNPCTADACDTAKGCVFTALAGKACDDGGPCTTGDVCVVAGGSAACKGTLKSCSDGNACTKDACATQTGACTHTAYAAGTPCEDGNLCTLGDTCTGSGAAVACAAGKPKGCNDGNVCTSDACDAKSGACKSTPVAAGTKCDDGKACTLSDVCKKDGASAICAGTLKTCDDVNPCSIDACVPSNAACTHVATTDGTPCASGKYCSGGACVPLATPPPATMVKIAGGAFRMGCHAEVDNQCEAGNEKPHHDVVLSSYYIDRYEVTSGEYKKCVGAKKCGPPSVTGGTSKSTYSTTSTAWDNRPVNFVNWNQAGAYCAWVGSRLCTEAEWEYAARGPKGLAWPWGNTAPTCAHANFYDAPNKKYCYVDQRPGPVGSWKAGVSPLGVHDMAGNVDEWVADRWSATAYADTPIRDPIGPKTGGYRVIRGGSWASQQHDLRTSARAAGTPTGANAQHGFRCCRSVYVKPPKCQGVVGYCDDGQLCTTDTCDQQTGECLHIPLPDGTPCANGKTCDEGKCLPLPPKNRVLIPAGSYRMGCNAAMDDQCKGDERPHHEVKLSAYHIDRHPVQASEYKICYEAGKCTLPSAGDGKSGANFDTFVPVNRQKHPINYVAYAQAEGYCAWAGARLCTEAEWEYAARGPKGYKYPWGNAEPNCAHGNFFHDKKYCSNPVGTMSVIAHPQGKSVMGVESMAGNVWEFTADRYGAYGFEIRVLDPPGPDKGGYRVMRGGSYKSPQDELRASDRAQTPGSANVAHGFRCCQKVAPVPAKCTTNAHCDDGQPCTTDKCTTSTGECAHIPLADKASCGSGRHCDKGRCIDIAVHAWTKIAGATFTMGCNPAVDKFCTADESPAHAVTLSAYEVGTSPVTAAQYKVCYEAGKCPLPAGIGSANGNFDAFLPANRQNHPVNYLARSHAEAYCVYASGRLCTEAEWEYAARGKDRRKYPWGNAEPNCAHANFVYNKQSCSPTKATMAVDNHPAGKSPFGVWDMAGNTREWVADIYGATYYASSPKTDPKGADKGGYGVMRGGYYADPAEEIRAGDRVQVTPATAHAGHGVRCCR